MKIIGGTRRSGRTTRLIELCHEEELAGNPSYIVCHSAVEARRIFSSAKEMNKSIPFPLTYDEFMDFRGAPVTFKFFIDNGEYLLHRLINRPGIEAIAITVDESTTPANKDEVAA